MERHEQAAASAKVTALDVRTPDLRQSETENAILVRRVNVPVKSGHASIAVSDPKRAVGAVAFEADGVSAGIDDPFIRSKLGRTAGGVVGEAIIGKRADPDAAIGHHRHVRDVGVYPLARPREERFGNGDWPHVAPIRNPPTANAFAL